MVRGWRIVRLLLALAVVLAIFGGGFIVWRQQRLDRALAAAAKRDEWLQVRSLLDAGARPEALESVRGDETLNVLTSVGGPDAVRGWLDHRPSPISSEALTQALMVASEAGQGPVVEVLLDRGADPNARDTRGRTPLMRAAGSWQPDAVRILLRRSADPTLRDAEGQTAEDHARSGGGWDAAANPNARAVLRLLRAGSAPSVSAISLSIR